MEEPLDELRCVICTVQDSTPYLSCQSCKKWNHLDCLAISRLEAAHLVEFRCDACDPICTTGLDFQGNSVLCSPGTSRITESAAADPQHRIGFNASNQGDQLVSSLLAGTDERRGARSTRHDSKRSAPFQQADQTLISPSKKTKYVHRLTTTTEEHQEEEDGREEEEEDGREEKEEQATGVGANSRHDWNSESSSNGVSEAIPATGKSAKKSASTRPARSPPLSPSVPPRDSPKYRADTSVTRIVAIEHLTAARASIVSSALDAQSQSHRFASVVESELFAEHSELDDDGYRSPQKKYSIKLRSLKHHLTTNQSLRSGIAAGEITAEGVVRLPIDALLSPAQRAFAEQVRTESLRISIMDVATQPTTVRTSDGEQPVTMADVGNRERCDWTGDGFEMERRNSRTESGESRFKSSTLTDVERGDGTSASTPAIRRSFSFSFSFPKSPALPDNPNVLESSELSPSSLTDTPSSPSRQEPPAKSSKFYETAIRKWVPQIPPPKEASAPLDLGRIKSIWNGSVATTGGESFEACGVPVGGLDFDHAAGICSRLMDGKLGKSKTVQEARVKLYLQKCALPHSNKQIITIALLPDLRNQPDRQRRLSSELISDYAGSNTVGALDFDEAQNDGLRHIYLMPLELGTAFPQFVGAEGDQWVWRVDGLDEERVLLCVAVVRKSTMARLILAAPRLDAPFTLDSIAS